MAFEKIARDALGNDGVIGFESVEVGVTHLSGDLEADVEELTDVGVVAGVTLIVSEGADVLFAGPVVDFFRAGELGVVDVDDGGVGLAESFFFLKGFGVNFFCQVEGFASGGREADDFFEPVGPCGFNVKTSTGARDGFFDRFVN